MYASVSATQTQTFLRRSLKKDLAWISSKNQESFITKPKKISYENKTRIVYVRCTSMYVFTSNHARLGLRVRVRAWVRVSVCLHVRVILQIFG